MKFLVSIFFAAAAVVCLPNASAAQSRDYFTPDEVEMIRNAQDIDIRIKVLVQTVDRRLTVLKLDPGVPVKVTKDSDKWGPMPEGTRIQLFTDISKILQKAIDDIDDTSAHAGTTMARTPEMQTKKDKVDPPFHRALRTIVAAAERFKGVLSAEADRTQEKAEQRAISKSVDLCDQIIEAISKLPEAQAPQKPR